MSKKSLGAITGASRYAKLLTKDFYAFFTYEQAGIGQGEIERCSC